MNRRFPVVERRWCAVCKSENESYSDDNVRNNVLPWLPTDLELASAFCGLQKEVFELGDLSRDLNESLMQGL